MVPQYRVAWPSGRSPHAALQSAPKGTFPKNGPCIAEWRRQGDCSHPSGLRPPGDPRRPSRGIEILSGSWVRIIAAIAARLLVGKEIYRHLLFVCSAARAVQAENRTTSDPNQPIIETPYRALSATFRSIATGSPNQGDFSSSARSKKSVSYTLHPTPTSLAGFRPSNAGCSSSTCQLLASILSFVELLSKSLCQNRKGVWSKA